MDPDSEAEQVASQILKTTLLTVVFSSCNYFKTETSASVSTIQLSLPKDSVVKSQSPSPKKKRKTIYLTFDDGPNKGTNNVYQIIDKEEVNATLFIIGQHVYGSKEQAAIFDSIVNSRYIEVANHSYTHAHNKFVKFYTVPDSVVSDFKRCADSLHLTSNIIRTPGRNIWRTNTINTTDINTSTAAADSLQQNNFTAVGWDLEWHFDNNLKLTETDDEVINEIDSLFAKAKTKTPDHLVLLAHDQAFANTADSAYLHQFIIKLKAKDEYDFENISKYPALKN
ncbi:MAG: polysaccharide deacetylase family protein [Chitinophagaceae bacterium]|nr:polysaccharide deacetylase family protein [Chitinophagaceae bacterium]